MRKLGLLENIKRYPLFRSKGCRYFFLLIISVILILSNMAGCSTWSQCKREVNYTPLSGYDWKVSTPAQQGLDPKLVSLLYCNADKLETIYSLLVIKNGYLVAERYFNEGSVKQKARLQ